MLRVATLNIHKGLSHFNRRVVIHDLREGLRALQPDLVFLQEVAGLNRRHALRYASWPGEGQHEFLAGSERPERRLFWPSGIASAGAMRQWGRQATAFVGRRHFDDADLIEKRFRLDLDGLD